MTTPQDSGEHDHGGHQDERPELIERLRDHATEHSQITKVLRNQAATIEEQLADEQ